MDQFSQSDINIIKQWLGTGSINLFGLPFSGKDTHSRQLAKMFGASVLGGGEILRNSQIPQHVRETLDAGKLVPIDDYVRIVLPDLSHSEFQGQPLILSSVGRWHGEEPGVVEAAAAANHPIKAVVFLSLSEDVSHARFLVSKEEASRGERADDAESKLSQRYDEFYKKTLPVLDYYRDRDLLIEVDGGPPKAEVSEAILRELLARAKKEESLN